MMSYDQIRSLAHHGHIVGSHTMTHPNMAYLTEDECENRTGRNRNNAKREAIEGDAHQTFFLSLSGADAALK